MVDIAQQYIPLVVAAEELVLSDTQVRYLSEQGQCSL